ncbi:MAG: RluA family pseudouridine synthase [Calditrichae bacterium]|nr:RluA family pseudouridine synthase [Calditrichota bacterium]MCB0311791.1 RluA family pseudouridine synthase [Calditrichota bacterium]MCB9088871.1 RluA family pseudouridine synthase [Calditrichia bacterium]
MQLKPFTYRNNEQRKVSVSLLYESEHLLAVNKPPGLPVIADRLQAEPNLRDLLQAQYERQQGSEGQAIWVVHRIDADTSGLVLFARTAEMHREMSLLFEHNQVHKTYLAVTAGAPETDEGEIDLPIGKHSGQKRLMRIDPRGKPSLTRYRVLERFRHFACLEMMPQSGRTHQIRVHLQALGCPLAIDPRYGSGNISIDISQIKAGAVHRSERHPERALISRLTLHASRVAFKDPLSGREIALEAPLPKDLAGLLQALRKWS